MALGLSLSKWVLCGALVGASVVGCAPEPDVRVWVVSPTGGALAGGLDALTALENLGSVSGVAPRAYGLALVESGSERRRLNLVGLSPLREATISKLPSPMVDGRTLSAEPGLEIVLAASTAAELGVEVGAAIRLEGSAHWDAYAVVGTSSAESTDGSRIDGWVHIVDLQELRGGGDTLDAVVLKPKGSGGLVADVRQRLPDVDVRKGDVMGPDKRGARLSLWSVLALVSAVVMLFGLWGWRRSVVRGE